MRTRPRSLTTAATRGAGRRPRRGISLVEVAAAGSLLALLTTLVAQLLIRVQAAGQEDSRRRLAIREADNLLERIASQALRAERWHDRASAWSLSPAAAEQLRDPELHVEIGDRDDAGLLPVTVTVSWTNSAKERPAPVQLTAWLPEQPAAAAVGGAAP